MTKYHSFKCKNRETDLRWHGNFHLEVIFDMFYLLGVMSFVAIILSLFHQKMSPISLSNSHQFSKNLGKNVHFQNATSRRNISIKYLITAIGVANHKNRGLRASCGRKPQQEEPQRPQQQQQHQQPHGIGGILRQQQSDHFGGSRPQLPQKGQIFGKPAKNLFIDLR